MRVSFKQSLRGGIPMHREHILHEQSISQMGLYQQYIKNNVQPLRDPDPEARPSAKPTFGNPWKVGGDFSFLSNQPRECWCQPTKLLVSHPEKILHPPATFGRFKNSNLNFFC